MLTSEVINSASINMPRTINTSQTFSGESIYKQSCCKDFTKYPFVTYCPQVFNRVLAICVFLRKPHDSLCKHSSLLFKNKKECRQYQTCLQPSQKRSINNQKVIPNLVKTEPFIQGWFVYVGKVTNPTKSIITQEITRYCYF